MTGFAELDSQLGPIEPGMMVLIEAKEDAYPTLLLHIICYNVILQGTRVVYVLVGDVADEYREMMTRLGYTLTPLEERGEWIYIETEDVNEFWNLCKEYMRKGVMIVLDTLKPPSITPSIIKELRRHGTVLVVRVDPDVTPTEQLAILERLAHILMRLYVERIGRRITRRLEVTKFKRTLRSDIDLAYVVSDTGIAMEALTRIA